MKNIRRRIPGFAFYDHSAIQAHLEKMAAQGWLVEKPGNFMWQYRRIEPKKLHIAVTYFPDASEFDSEPTEGQMQMEEYCARDGWIPAARWGQMQIFYNEEENPVPIETDAVTQVETVHQAMRRNMLPRHLLILVLCVYQLIFIGCSLLSNPVRFLSTPSFLYMFPAWMLILPPTLFELCAYFRWYRRAKAVADSGVFLPIKTYRAASWVLLSASVLLILLAFCSSETGKWAILIGIGVTLAVIFSVGIVTGWLKRKGASRSVNRTWSMVVSVVLAIVVLSAMTVAIIRYGLPDGRSPVGTYELYGITRKVYNDYLPLRIEDLMEIDNEDWSLEQRRDETVLLSNTEFRQWPLTIDKEIPALEYTVTEIKAPFLYDLCKKGWLKQSQNEVRDDGVVVLRDEYVPSDAAPWDANAAYQLYFSSGYLNRYLLCYENRIVEIQFDWEPTPGQMAVVAERLGKDNPV